METLHIDNMTERDNISYKPSEALKQFSASRINGNHIFNPEGENIGKVKDVIFDIAEGKIEYLIIEVGGFLGMNQKYFGVPLKDLKVAKEHRNAFLLNETKESLKRYSEYGYDQWPNTDLQEGNTGKSNESTSMDEEPKR